VPMVAVVDTFQSHPPRDHLRASAARPDGIGRTLTLMERPRRKAGRAPAGSRGNVPYLSPSVIQAAQVERRLGVAAAGCSLATIGSSAADTCPSHLDGSCV